MILAAIERGEGEAVTLVHGGIIHGGPAWAKSIQPLAQAGYRVIAVDRRGHGRSGDGDETRIPVHLHALDLQETLRSRDIAHAHLVGVSYGALVCLEFALSWPDEAASLTLIEPPLFTWMPEVAAKFAVIRKQVEEGLPLADWVPLWLGLIDKAMAAKTNPASPTWKLVERAAAMIFKEEPGWRYTPDMNKVRELRLPTLVISGDVSEQAMQDLSDMVADAIPGAKRVVIEGGGHDAHARRSEEFNQILVEFLNSSQT